MKINHNKKVVESGVLDNHENDSFQIDVDWYLSHGYSKVEDMFKEIESIEK